MMFLENVEALCPPRIMSDARMLDVAIASAVARDRLKLEEVDERIEQWFGPVFDGAAITGRIGELERIGWLTSQSDRILLTPEGADCVTRLYGGAIRMLDRGLGLIEESVLTKVFAKIEGERA